MDADFKFIIEIRAARTLMITYASRLYLGQTPIKAQKLEALDRTFKTVFESSELIVDLSIGVILLGRFQWFRPGLKMFSCAHLKGFMAGCDFSILLCSLLFFILQHLIQKRKKEAVTRDASKDDWYLKSEDDLPAVKSYPIFGCKFALNQHLHRVLAEVAENEFEKRIFQVKAGCRRFVVFSKIDDIEHIAKAYPEELFGKPHSFTTGKVSLGAHNDILERWKKRRAYTNAGLKNLEKYDINDIMSEEIMNLMSYLDSTIDLDEDSPHDVRHDVTYYISRVLFKMSYGKTIDKRTEMRLKKIVHDLPDYTTSMGSFSRYDMFPFLRFFFRRQYNKFIKFNKMMKEFCNEQSRKLKSSVDGQVSLWSFFSEKLSRFGQTNLSFKFPGLKESLFDGLEDIIRAGTESTSLIIQWLIAYAAKYQHVQHKMQSEIDNVLRSKSKLKPDLEDIGDLPYCRAVLAETHRFCSLNPFLKRQLTGDIVTKDGYELKKGTSLLFNNWALNFDKSYWTKPEEFYPERFIDEIGKFDDSKFERMFSFGFGKRRCIGVYTGRSLCFLTAVNIFKKFELIQEKEIDIDPVDGIGLSPKPFKVFMRRR